MILSSRLFICSSGVGILCLMHLGMYWIHIAVLDGRISLLLDLLAQPDGKHKIYNRVFSKKPLLSDTWNCGIELLYTKNQLLLMFDWKRHKDERFVADRQLLYVILFCIVVQ